MSTFRTCWRVLFAQRTMILVYIVYLSLMMFGLSWSIIQNLSNTDNSTTYETLRPEVAVVDRNGGVGSGFSDSLRKFLSKDCDLVDVGTTSQDLQTAAASNYADLIAVSYTHLDVYKRQRCPRSGTASPQSHDCRAPRRPARRCHAPGR